MKAAGVVVDDTAVTPRYVEGFHPERELPVIRRIASGSLRNKLLFILPALLLLSQFASWLLTPLLMVGGVYLCYEGAEKLWEVVRGHESHDGHEVEEAEAILDSAAHEEQLVGSAIRTDFILSAEIMVIALDEVAEQGLLSRALILVVVAFVITAVVYGVVGLIVKMDDVGLRLAERSSRPPPRSAGGSYARCRRCSRPSRPSGSPRCSGWAATSSSSGWTSSVSTRSTTSCTTPRRRCTTPSARSVASAGGSPTRRSAPSSASRSAASPSPPCTAAAATERHSPAAAPEPLLLATCWGPAWRSRFRRSAGC